MTRGVMTIGRKIWLLVLIALASSALVSVLGMYGVRLVNSNVEEIAERSVPAVLLVSEMRTRYLALIPQVYNRATTQDPATGKVLDAKLAAEIDALIDALNVYNDRTTDEEEKKALDHAKRGFVTFVTTMRQISGLASAGEPQMALDLIHRDVDPLHQRLSKDFDVLVAHNVGVVKAQSQAAETTYARTLKISLAAAIVGLGIIGVMGGLLGRSITRPLETMQRAIARTASELDFREDIAVRSKDEIGRTLSAYNALLIRLRASFSDIQAASSQMVDITSGVDESSRQIAENSGAQSDASAEMAAAIEQLSVSISMVASQAHEVSLHSQQSHAKADQGGEIILATVSGIQTISTSVREASTRIEALRDDSQSISEVANIIQEIAEQTNLLALNAAIEAARAGEQGRGFAVVADEVRKLAERTAKSTQEISALLAKMQSSANLAVDTMLNAVQEVDRGVEHARLAGQSIQEIKTESRNVVSKVEEISGAMREQSTASTAISGRIEQIVQMVERNSAAAQDTAAAVKQMTAMSRDIANTLTAYKV